MIRRELLIGGHDPGSLAGQIAFMELSNPERARYLKRIEYLSGDISNLLSLLPDTDRAEVLAYRDEYGSELAWP